MPITMPVMIWLSFMVIPRGGHGDFRAVLGSCTIFNQHIVHNSNDNSGCQLHKETGYAQTAQFQAELSLAKIRHSWVRRMDLKRRR